MKLLLKVLVCLCLLCECSNGKIDGVSADLDEIGIYAKTINDSLFPCSVAKNNRNLIINFIVPIEEIYFEKRMVIVQERAIVLMNKRLLNLDTVFFNFDIKGKDNENLIYYFTSNQINNIIEYNAKNKMLYDFNTYLFKHITPSKLESFNVYLKVLRKEYPNISIDFIEIIHSLFEEKRNGLKEGPAHSTLIMLKDVILNVNEWKEFKQEDIDYFINYPTQ